MESSAASASSSSASASSSAQPVRGDGGRRSNRRAGKAAAAAKRRPTGMPMTSIPDMRFEQSFLASIRAFIHEVDEDSAQRIKQRRRSSEAAAQHDDDDDDDPLVKDVLDGGLDEKVGWDADKHDDEEEKRAPNIMTSTSPKGEPELWLGRLRVEWWPLLYLTVRDQLLSPIVQGAIFGMGGLALGHVRTFMTARRQQQQQAQGNARTGRA